MEEIRYVADNSETEPTPDTLPSAADLDAVAAEETAKDETNGVTVEAVLLQVIDIVNDLTARLDQLDARIVDYNRRASHRL